MEVKLGANNRKVKEVTQRVVSVQAISSHSMHVWFERNDIALLQLANPVNFTEYIQPVCLPDENEPLPLHSECWTVGWGKTKWDGKAYPANLNPSPTDKFIDWFKLKAVADNKTNITEKTQFVLGRVEKHCGEGRKC